MGRLFDHIDLRVRDLRRAAPFYERLLPLLGFTERVEIDGWLQFERPGPDASEFFGVTEDPAHTPNRTRIAFPAKSIEQVNELARAVRELGALNIEGPDFEAPDYYAVYFEDPSGNALEVCYRARSFRRAQDKSGSR